MYEYEVNGAMGIGSSFYSSVADAVLRKRAQAEGTHKLCPQASYIGIWVGLKISVPFSVLFISYFGDRKEGPYFRETHIYSYFKAHPVYDPITNHLNLPIPTFL